LRQLGFLKVNFRREETAEDDHRVLALFRNRAELKKAYGELQEEIYRLKDRIKQQEGATQRVQEMLGALEGRLGLSETAFPALVFYQLRRLWQTGRELLERFVTELAAQQDERERRQHLAEHNRRVFAKRQAADQRLRGAQRLVAEEAARLTDLESQRARLQRFWHYFKRRALEQTISQARGPRLLPTSPWSRRARRSRKSSANRFPSSPVFRSRRDAPSTSRRSRTPRYSACGSPARSSSCRRARQRATGKPPTNTARARSAKR